jgi:hypothetical protein
MIKMKPHFKCVTILLAAIWCLPAPLFGGDDQALSNQLEVISDDFSAGEFDSCKIKLENLATQESQMKPATRLKYYQLQARLSFAFENRVDMEMWIRKFYDLNPRAELDGSQDPPEALTLLAKIKSEEELKRRHADEEMQASIDIERKSFTLSVLPFGLGHVYQGRFLSGLFFMAAETGYVLHLNQIDQERESIVGSRQAHAKMQWSTRDRPQGVYALGAVSGFLGLWAYETISLKRSLLAADFNKASTLRRVVSLAPLGAAQWQNRSYFKGLFFLVSELSLISISSQNYVKSEIKPQAFGVLVALMALGAVDGYSNYKPVQVSAIEDSPFHISPSILASGIGQYGLGINIGYDL